MCGGLLWLVVVEHLYLAVETGDNFVQQRMYAWHDECYVSVLNTYLPVGLRNTEYSACAFTISRFSAFILSSKIKVVRLLGPAGFLRHSL